MFLTQTNNDIQIQNVEINLLVLHIIDLKEIIFYS